METKELFTREIIIWISDAFGNETAELYKKFYKTHDFETIYQAANELMVEYMGEKKANEVLTQIKIKIGIYEAK